MSRALRYAPPLAERHLVLRPRLLERLRSRFQRPLVVVTAHAGFGKTTLLMQAVEENQLSPLGADRWLTCQADDASLSFLATGALAAVGSHRTAPDNPRDAAVAVAEAMWAAAPLDIALILDDAHLVPHDSPGATFLRMLVEELPHNGHLVVAARPEIRLATGRMLASGRAIEIGAEELLFSNDELSEFATARDVPVDGLGGAGSWPGLVELTASVGSEAVVGYLWEELLAQFPRERRRALGILSAVGGADAEMATALLGSDVDLDEVLQGLPLVVRAADGWRSLHAMWGRALRHQLDAREMARVRQTAGLELARRHQYHEAMDLLIEAEAWDDVRILVTEICEVCTPLVPCDVLEAWQRRLPEHLAETAEGLLLAAMIAEPGDPVSGERLLEEALRLAGPESRVRYACLNALIQLAFWRSDRAKMLDLLDQITVFAVLEHPRARAWVALLTALLRRDCDEVRAALADPALHRHAVLNPVQDWLHAHIVLLKLGNAARAEVLAQRALAHKASTMVAVSRSALAESYRLQGLLDAAAQLTPDLLADLEPSKVVTSPELVTQAVVLLDVLGRTREAEDVLEALLPVMEQSPVAWAPLAEALATAFHQVSRGEEAIARARLDPLSELSVLRNPAAAVQVSPSALVLLYVLLPRVREGWDAYRQPGALAHLQSLARALVALRERGATDAVAHLSLDARRIMEGAMPLPWLAELAVGLVAGGDEHGRVLLESLGNRARPTLHRQASSAHRSLARTAVRLLHDMPAMPTYQLHVQTLGPMRVWRDGEEVLAPELKRVRVRQLLGYLVMHRQASRTHVSETLWPDLEASAGGRNLRTTLGYLLRVLEPERGEHDPPFFVRSRGNLLELVQDPALTVDVVMFEQHLDTAAHLERQGAPSAALQAYAEATRLWHGDFLDDTASGDWAEDEQHRLRTRFAAAAARAGHLHLAHGDLPEAEDLGRRALQADPWSETAYQLLVAAALESGEEGSARLHLKRCFGMLTELDASPSQETLTLTRRVGFAGRPVQPS